MKKIYMIIVSTLFAIGWTLFFISYGVDTPFFKFMHEWWPTFCLIAVLSVFAYVIRIAYKDMAEHTKDWTPFDKL